MPIPSLITDLSATIASNSPAGGDPPTQGDDFIRAHAGFIRQLYDSDASNLAKLANAASATESAALLGYDPVTAYVSGIGKHLNYTFGRTALEIAASVTPTNYAYFPGDIRRYGAVSGGSAATNVAAAQLAINAGHRVFSPVGTFAMGATALDMPTGTTIEWESRLSTWQWSGAAQMLRGKDGTTTRTFNAMLISGTISNTTRATVGGIGIDFKSMTGAKVFGMQILEVETGVKNGGASSQGAFYNEFHAVDISGVTTGYDNGTLGNDCKVFGGRVNDSVTGTRDNDCSGNLYVGCAVETFSVRGHLVADVAAATNIKFLASRLESSLPGAVGIDIRAAAQVCNYFLPQFTALATDVVDATTVQDSLGLSDNGLVLKSGTPLKKFLGTTATIDFGSIAAGATADIFVAITGVIGGDLAMASCVNSALEAGITITAQAATDGVNVRATNSTTGAINPASHSYAVAAWRF